MCEFNNWDSISEFISDLEIFYFINESRFRKANNKDIHISITDLVENKNNKNLSIINDIKIILSDILRFDLIEERTEADENLIYPYIIKFLKIIYSSSKNKCFKYLFNDFTSYINNIYFIRPLCEIVDKDDKDYLLGQFVLSFENNMFYYTTYTYNSDKNSNFLYKRFNYLKPLIADDMLIENFQRYFEKVEDKTGNETKKNLILFLREIPKFAEKNKDFLIEYII